MINFTNKYAVSNRKLLKYILVILCFEIYFCDPLVIETNKGKVCGSYDPETGGKVFLGIPFAAPPTGALRLKPPQPAKSWKPTIRNALQYGNSCVQTPSVTSEVTSNLSEDCLYLNVWTPKNQKEPLPVLVWIYGGSFQYGSSNELFYNGNRLSKQGNVVVVTLNYRVSIFGFMASDLLSQEDPDYPTSGNYGLLDQIYALKWVRDNIREFGGDPNKVTIFGESAGAVSCCLHLIIPKSKGLFKRAILESGSCVYPSDKESPSIFFTNIEFEKANQLSKKWMRDLNCQNLSCFRSLSTETIFNYMVASQLEAYPVIDKLILPEYPIKLLSKGKYHKVEIIVGTNQNEGSLFISDYPPVVTKIDLEQFFIFYFPKNSADLIEMYSIEKYGSVYFSFSAFLGDFKFTCNGRQLLHYLNSNGPTKVFQYRFTKIPDFLPNEYKIPLGSFHGAEIFYVFHHNEGNRANPTNATFTASESSLSLHIQDLWSSFSKNGQPVSNNSTCWIPYTKNLMPYLEINADESTLKYNLNKAECDLYDKILPIRNNEIC